MDFVVWGYKKNGKRRQFMKAGTFCGESRREAGKS
jgi:hypothetical protein